MASDPNLQSTGGGSAAVASESVDPNRTFVGFKQLVNFSVDSKRLQELIDKQTEDLAEAKKAPPGDFQRAHIHQINNILFRSGYELDQIREEYRRTLGSCIEELQIDWNRMKSNWVQDENQLFLLQVLLAKCEFLKANAKELEGHAEAIPALDSLLDEVNRFTSAHLSSGTLPDSCLEAMSDMVARLGEILTGAYELAIEMPPWRGSLAEPKMGALSASLLSETQGKVKSRVDDIPSEIAQIQRLLPGGSWRAELDLRPEMYAFADILFPGGALQKVPVRDTLQYLDNDVESRLRRMQMEKLKGDSDRCKHWLEIREKHQLLLEKAVSLAKEGNYLQAAEFIGQTQPIFSDVNYQLYQETTKLWLDQAMQLRKRLEALATDLEKRIKGVFSQPYLPFPRTAKMKRCLAEATEALAKEVKALEKYAQTDFFREVSASFAQATSRIKETEEWAIRRRRLCRSMAMAEAGVVFLFLGIFSALYLHAVESTVSTLSVEVTPWSLDDPVPDIDLGSHHQKAFMAEFLDLAPANYPLTIRAKGFVSKHYQITIESGQKAKWGPIQLEPITGLLRLEPAQGDYDFEIHPLNEKGEEGAPVKVRRDGAATVGRVKKDEGVPVDLRPGRYRIYFSEGEKGSPDSQVFDVVSEIMVHQVTSYKPNFNFGLLEIKTDPAGADVSIDGKIVGKTPFSKRIAPIAYSLDVAKEHYESYYSPIQLEPGGHLPLDLKLKLKPLMPSTNLEGPPSDLPTENNSSN